MRKELHIWFGRNMPRLDLLDGDIIESYDGLSNMCRVLKNNYDEQQDGDIVIHTHNIIFANGRVIEEYRFRLFIHPAIGDMFEITFGECANTRRELMPYHCLWHMLLCGEFDTDECQVISEDF